MMGNVEMNERDILKRNMIFQLLEIVFVEAFHFDGINDGMPLENPLVNEIPRLFIQFAIGEKLKKSAKAQKRK